MEIIDAMKERENICNYLDMPLQHASDRMLKAMKRQITRVEMEDIIGEIKYKIPGICLRTTLISGFPGETQDDVEELKTFLKKIEFDRVGIFTYSHEENTSAYDLADNISAEVKEQRAREIMDVQQEISYQKNTEKIGRTFKVIIDKKEAGRYLGRTELDSVEVDNEVIVHSSKKLYAGDFVNVTISNAFDYDLEGEVILQ
jgi:ribosomal protein S12 methylthiotransferase